MSTQESGIHPTLSARNLFLRKMIEVDLNVLFASPSEHRETEGSSTRGGTHDEQTDQQAGPLPPPAIVVEAIDDDVVISSPRAFAEAKSKSRRTRGRTVVVDVDSEGRSSRFAPKRRRNSANQTIINCDGYVNLESSSSSKREKAENVMPPPPPPPKEPTFSCPVCMGPLVEEMSTKCGHIFCKACIKASIASQNKCPTCRRKVTLKDTIRVYLPTAN